MIIIVIVIIITIISPQGDNGEWRQPRDIHSSHGSGTSARKTKPIFSCAGHDRIISSGIPSDIIDTRDTTDIIDTLGTVGIFHPALELCGFS